MSVIIRELYLHLGCKPLLIKQDSLSQYFIEQSENDDAREGRCARGVANILENIGVSVTRNHAYTWKDTLPQNGWVKLEGVRPEDAPSGAVAVYDRNPPGQRAGEGGSEFGHVEIIAEDSSGKRHYVSDKARSNSGGTVPDNFVGVYVNPKLTPIDNNVMLASNTSSIEVEAEKKNTQEAKDRAVLNQSVAGLSDASSNSGNFNSMANQSPMLIFATIIAALFKIDMGLDDKSSPSADTMLAANEGAKNTGKGMFLTSGVQA